MGGMTEPGSMKHKDKYNARKEKANKAADSVKQITSETVKSEADSASKLSGMTA